MAFHVPNQYRVREGRLASDDRIGNNGLFIVKNHHGALRVIASDGMDWEHVSVSLAHRCPSWREMCEVKALFWDPEDVVIQYHPRESQYVNNLPYCLHLWRPQTAPLPEPPSILVGVAIAS